MISSVAIVTLNYTDAALADTLACLTSLLKAWFPPRKVIYVVAMESSKKTVAALQKHPLQPIVLEDNNIGFTGGNNKGIEEAMAEKLDAVVLLNNDTVVAPTFLKPLLAKLAEPTVGMVVPKIYFAPSHEFHAASYTKSEQGKVIWYAGGLIDWQNMYGSHRGVDEVDHGQFDVAGETDFATGCCVALPTSVISHVGMFDNNYFLYYEDLDWSMRMRKAGYSLWYEPASVIWHKNAGSTQGAGSSLHMYYQTRNRFLFALRYAPFRTKLAILRESFRKYTRGKQIERNAILDAWKGHYGKRSD